MSVRRRRKSILRQIGKRRRLRESLGWFFVSWFVPSFNIEHKNGMPEAVMDKARVAGDFYTRRPISGRVHLNDDAGDALPGFWGDIQHPSAGRSRELDHVRSFAQIVDRYGSLASDSRIVDVNREVSIRRQFTLVFSARRGADPNQRRERASAYGNSPLHHCLLH